MLRESPVSALRHREFQAEDKGDERLEVGAAGGNAGHADGAGVCAGPLEKERNSIGVEASAGEIGSVVGSFAAGAVAFVAFVRQKASLALCDERIGSGS